MPEEQLASLESSMSTLLTTSQSTATALVHVLALVDLISLTESIPAASTMVQVTTAAIALSTDLANLPTFLESYKVQVIADAKVKTKARLCPTVISCLCPSLPPIYDGAHGTGHDFIKTCNLYVGLCPKQFPNNYISISWALTFMQQGQVAKFVAHIFQFDGIKKLFQDWDHFVSTFAN
ncbi:hypothetical protein DXG03_009292, partial [Asterophora parasitica]